MQYSVKCKGVYFRVGVCALDHKLQVFTNSHDKQQYSMSHSTVSHSLLPLQVQSLVGKLKLLTSCLTYF